jgi:CBS domain-containing protein
MTSYLEIRRFRDDQIILVSRNHFMLNRFHDEIIHRVISVSVKQTEAKYGPLPCHFTFFMMGSAGRFEQSLWSDQDHGIIYAQHGTDINDYFLQLGKEISFGLQLAGYDYCDGAVMASNPLWCKSLSEWRQQLANWSTDSNWECIRHLLIFVDGRTLYGDASFLENLKLEVYQTIHKENLFHKVHNNTLYLKKGIGVLGQILVETHGPHTGSLNIKEKALFPYVNAIRLLAIKGNIVETSTLSRLEKMSEKELPSIKREFYKQQFLKLLNFRLTLSKTDNYENSHYLPISTLSKKQKEEVKEILKNGNALYRYVRKLIEKEDYLWE